MSIEQLVGAARAFQQLAGETSRYAIDETATRGGVAMALLLIDVAELTGSALASFSRGHIRLPIWEAVVVLAGEVAENCRAIGNDGQFARCAAAADELGLAWRRHVARLSVQEKQDAATVRPDPDLQAPEDPELTEALRETFPASDPIAPAKP